MPSLDKFTIKNPDFLVFPINLEKINQKKTMKFYNDLNIKNLNIFFDPEFKLAKQFKLRGVPTTIIVDPTSKVISKHEGILKWGEDEIISKINSLFY